MNKKFISIAMAMVLSISSAAFAASAAEVEIEESGDATGTIRFDMGDWDHNDNIYFYIWDETNGQFATKEGWQDSNPWGSKKKLAGTKVEGEDGIVESYEFSIPDGHDVFVIFHDPNTGAQTYNCTLDASAFGDTAYLTGNVLENPEDSEKTCIEARFQNADCGPAKVITSSGNIVGDYITPNTDRPGKVAEFVYKYYGQTEKLSGAEIVTEETVANAIAAFETNADDVWAKFQEFNGKEGYENYSSIEEGAKKMIKPSSAQESSDSDSDSDDDNSSTGSTGSNTNSTSSNKTTTTTSTKTTTTTTTSTTGTADAAATGDTTGTVAFAVVLLAAAAGIVATRKKIEE